MKFKEYIASENLNVYSITLGATPPSGYTPGHGTAISQVNVALDTLVIKPGNIAVGATILGVEGTHSGGGGALTPVVLAPGSLDFSAGAQTFTSPVGYDGMSSVTIETPTNLISGNIKRDITIAGVTGKSSVVDTEVAGQATIDSANIAAGTVVYANGASVTGTLQMYDGSFTVPSTI